MSATADILSALKEGFPELTARPSADHAAINVPIARALDLLSSLRTQHGYDFLCDITAIDWSAEASPRFTVVWHLYSISSARYVRVAANCESDSEPSAPTATGLWPAANWHERETYDLLGITFTGHPDLRRILMWDGYPYHPLRKEFPLAGLPTELPDEEVSALLPGKVISAPMAGGPFVASSGELNYGEAEPRAKDESWNEKREKPSS